MFHTSYFTRFWLGFFAIAFSGSEASSRRGSIRVAWPKGQGASHFLSLFPIPYSLLPAPCSLKPKTFYLIQLTITIVQSTLHQNQPQSI
ncbi:hypothetical protein [Moorena producens]|uniref:hypothetical protein n=1 Tax=Moorena producens TaxID=1155739 RepID=UPI003C755DE9